MRQRIQHVYPLMQAAHRRGQALIEFVLILPLVLLLVLGGLGVGLSLLATSQVQTAALEGALVGTRTDAASVTTTGSCSLTVTTPQTCSCPSAVISSVQSIVYQSLNVNASSVASSTENIYGVIPVKSIGGSITCSDGFSRSQSGTTGNGTGLPNTVTVTLTGNIDLTFIPIVSPSVPISETSTAVVEPYRSRS